MDDVRVGKGLNSQQVNLLAAHCKFGPIWTLRNAMNLRIDFLAANSAARGSLGVSGETEPLWEGKGMNYRIFITSRETQVN